MLDAEKQALDCGRERDSKRAFSQWNFGFLTSYCKLSYQVFPEIFFERDVPSQFCPILQSP